MKTKITVLLLACALLLTACGGGGETSGTVDNQSKDESVVTDTSNSQVSTPEVSADSAEASDEVSEEVSIAPEGGIYTGQDISTHGVDEYKLADFLEGSLFVGDSVTDGFKLYVNNYGDMPAVNFFSGSSYGYQSACKDKTQTNTHPKIGGEAKYIWEACEYYEAKRVFINFGLNDFGYIGDSKLLTCLQTICANIHAESPETEIVFLSSGFFTKEGQTTGYGYSNDQVRSKNEVVLNFCKDNGYDFIDVSWAYADAEGNLISEYSYDNYCHLSYDNYDKWEQILKGYAADKILNQYKNIKTMVK